MRISVITVCRNAEETIAHTLDSFVAQDHDDKEMLVIDGASTDGTADVVRRYGGGQVSFVSEPDCGMYDALNKGLARFSGEAVGVLNADDAYHDTTALSQVARFLSAADMVHANLNFVNNHTEKRVVRQWRAEPPPEGGFRTGWMPAHPTFYVRRAVAEAVGSFDLTLKIAADYDWMLRAIDLHDYLLGTMDAVLVDMQAGGKSTAGLGSHVAHNLEALRARQRWLNAGWVDYALVAKPARKLGQFVRRGVVS